eukprot:11217663-Alexandrium_andersonii.AAC.1
MARVGDVGFFGPSETRLLKSDHSGPQHQVVSAGRALTCHSRVNPGPCLGPAVEESRYTV